jgi:transformation/transcription domain-associated protein
MTPTEALEPYAAQIVDKLMGLVRTENEDNGILIVKTIMDFLRHQHKAVEDRVQPFLDLIQEMFQTMEQTVKDTFDNPQNAPAAASTPGHSQYSQSPRPGSPVSTVSSDIGNEQQQTRQLQKGMHSFKVLSECPIIVVSIFQSNRPVVNKNVRLFVPLIKNVLLLQAKPQEKAHADAKARGDIFTGVSKDIKNRAAFGDFILMQVKTMSFLAYLLRVYAQQLTDFLPTLPDIVIRMLKDCPRERSGARKELLVAIRHIINFNFRKIFLKKIDELLDERTLIGDGLTVYETMRPLAYSMLADLIHHLRESLSKEQIRKTIEVYTKNLHDDFPGTSFQTMSAKLLLNMAECISKLEPKEDARHFLIMILNAIGDKFSAMNRQFDNAVKLSKQCERPSIEAAAENYLAEQDCPPDWDEIDIFNATPIKTSNPRDKSADPVADNKFLFKNLLQGLKNLFYQLRNTNPPRLKDESEPSVFPANWNDVSFGYTAEELAILTKLFREGCRVFRYYGLEKQSTELQALTTSELLATAHMMTGGKDEKDLLETFATVFHHIDPATFHEIFHAEIPHLYEMCFEHSPLLHIAQFLLASEATSPSFCGMLLHFLMQKIDEVGTADVKKASILLRLFKLSFMAVTLFATQNEQVLLPHVTKIATKAIQLSTTAEDPMNYFLLLRSLFRSIGGGRFEHLYKELLPLLEMLLEVLNNLLDAARKPQERDLFVELILTVPARLSNLLPHLSYLMRPLVVALGAGSDLVGQGLRTLELCVDNLTADYIDPIMAPVIDELMTGLWDHLRPAPYPHFHAHTTMRILGKLGGRNRKFLNGLPPLEYKPYTDDEASFDIRLVGSSRDRAFPAITGVDFAISKIMETPKKPADKVSDIFHKRQAFKLIQAQIKLHIGLENLPDDFAQLVRLQANDLVSGKLDLGEDLFFYSEREKSASKRDAQQETLKKLLKACHFATSVPDLNEDATALMQNLCRHFALLEIGRALAQVKHARKPFDVQSGEGPLYIDSRVIADAIAESLASDYQAEREAAEASIMTIRDTAVVVFGGADKVDKMPFFVFLAKQFAHNCHQEEWYIKAGGTFGIKILCTKVGLSDGWMVERHHDLVRALMYVLKDMPPDVAAKTRIEAEENFEALIRRCTNIFTKADLEKPQSKLNSLCKFMVQELCHSTPHVRTAAQKFFAVIADALGVGIHEALAPVKEVLLTPIFNKPLRALPFGIQIGYIDAITFCLRMPNNLVPFEEPLTRLLMESLALADADDETLTTKPLEHRNAEHIVNLRVGCIKLLSTAQNSQEFNTQSPNQSRQRIIAVFFRSLYSKSPEVVEAANAGLKGVLANQQKLPKDLLQSGLRPILMNLQDPRKLSVEGLEGLARLLKLLTNYFKVEIGTRLLDHMKTIADAATLQKVSFMLIEQNRNMRVITAILNIFHLLPSAAVSFLPSLVSKVVELESALRRTQFSPFREPLIKYLNIFPDEAWKHFAPKMRDQTYGRFFAQLLNDPEAQPLREAVANDCPGFLASFQIEGEDKDKARAAINATHVAWSICQHSSTRNWLVTHEDLRKALMESAKGVEKHLRANDIDSALRLAAEQSGDQTMDLLTIFIEQEPSNFDFFFEVVEAVTSGALKSTPTLYSFIYKNMIAVESVDYSRSLVIKCIDFYAARSHSQKAKTFLFRNVVNPIFAIDVQRNWDSLFGPGRGTKLVDVAMLQVVLTKLWRPQSVGDISEEAGQLGVDHARMELLQLTALLLKYHTNLLQDARKEIIKFGWSWIKLEDVINKHAAYVVISYFVARYDTPAKIAISVYQTLLKAHQNEGRSLVTQALELMAPVLKKRLGAMEQQRLPLWARLPKKILAEDSHNLQQLMSIFNFFVRHEELFYEAREALAPTIIPALQKIAQPPVQSNDSKKIAINLIDMIWKWEERSYKESLASPTNSPESTKRRADGSAAPGNEPRKFIANQPLRMILIKYLVQFTATLSEQYPVASERTKEARVHLPPPTQQSETVKKAVRLLHNLLQAPYWTDLDIDHMFPKVIEHILTSDQEQEKREIWIARQINALQVVKVMVNVKSDEWVLNRISYIEKLVDKPMKLDDVMVQDCLHSDGADTNGMELVPLFKRILEVLPDPTSGDDETMEDTPGSEFMANCSNAASEGLASNNLNSSINLLWSMCQRRPAEVDTHVQNGLMKVFNTKLAKDHIATYSPQAQTPFGLRPGEQANQSPLAPYDMEIQTGLILKVIDILSARIEILGEQRRPFLSALATLVERSQSREVCMKILDLAEHWIFSSEGVPTLKEKVAVLSKMFLFEHRQDPSLLTRFLNLVIRVYEDPKVTRTELTVRLEHAFLIGTRAQDVEMRNRFLTIFDKHISRSPNARLDYLLCAQDWSPLLESFWLSQVIHLLNGSIEPNVPIQFHQDDFRTLPASTLFGTYAKDSRISDVIVDDACESFLAEHRRFCNQMADVKLKDVMDPLVQLQHTDKDLAHQIWVALFPIFWAAVPKEDRSDFEVNITSLLSKDFHYRQIDARPNCVHGLLEGIVRAKPRMKIPPHVVKFVAKTYNVWYTAATYLEESAVSPMVDTANVRESTLDALIELYAGLEETDLFYGTWRRRCQYVETNAALSYEQIGMWDKAQQMYESAQIKARTGALPFSQGEYMLWEDHWVYCAQKMQQWEILQDFAKHENFNDLYLEATWREVDAWQNNDKREQLDSIIKSVADAPTPRRLFFQAFMSLLKVHSKTETTQDFTRICDEAIQNSIRKWHQLPKRITNAHVPLLQSFQHLVELYDALTISNSLNQTNQANLDAKSQDLKMHLGTWRDRLPNFWDDINAWQDLVTWRQHIFHLVNSVYLSLIPQNQPNATNNSYAYRGFHEQAWIINRFAHVARQHNLPDVCIAQLSRIYTLPNIEIQEAFLKLREQAKCHYQNKNELNSGLDVINNTNLNYFGQQQKAEFYTLKGMFLNKLGQKAEANEAFGSALYFDIKLAKAWAEWGHYNDQLFKEDPKNLEKAASAISCYLEASSLYKNHKSRKLLGRILWLLSLDDADHQLAKGFEQFKGDTPVWYWITYIPQLILDLSRPEAPIAQQILGKLAKAYPQALFFQLRTSREDMAVIRKQQEAKERQLKEQAKAKNPGQSSPAQGSPKQGSPPSRPQTANGPAADGENGTPNGAPNGTPKVEGEQSSSISADLDKPKKPWEYMEGIMAALKTAFPLLAWSMEAMAEQIGKHFKCQPDEDAHRLIVALLNDGLSYVGRQPGLYAQDVKLPPSTEANITRFAESVCPPHIRKSFEADFVKVKPTMYEYIQKLRKWRNRFEERLDRRPASVALESFSPHLVEFRFQKFDDVEVPGQYLKHSDKNQDFIRIERFIPDVDLVRGTQVCYRRLKIRGHDGSVHPFQIQHPAGRHTRREERILQLFRIFNEVLLKRKESRRRNLQFNLPLIIPLTPAVRMIEDDASYISLQGVYEDFCRRNGVNKDEPVLYTIEKLRQLNPVREPLRTHTPLWANKEEVANECLPLQKSLDQANSIRLETFIAVQEKYIPASIALEYFQSTYPSYDDFWLFRRAFSYQLASLSFMTFIMCMSQRYPHKLNISRASGRVWGSELVPSMGNARPQFNNPEGVPYRLTPNLQTLMGPIVTEGIFAPALMTLARCLTEREGEMEMQLSVFVRDEVTFWYTQQHKTPADNQLRDAVQGNTDLIMKRAASYALPPTVLNLPSNQTTIDGISSAVDPKKLSQTDPLWMAYL